jgi:hypothetical protein
VTARQFATSKCAAVFGVGQREIPDVWAYAHGGWTLAAAIGGALPLAALAYLATE